MGALRRCLAVLGLVGAAAPVAQGVLGAPGGAGAAGAASTAPAAGQPAVGAQPSSGCSAPPVAPGVSDVPLEAGGESGHYYREVPRSYTGRSPVPVVIDFHGYAEPASVQVTLTQLGALGEAQGFVTVTPEISHPGLPRAGPLWNTALGGPDLQWVGGLLDDLEHTLCVDQHRIYVTGYSNGAFLSSAIACEYAGRVAAVAPVAGIETSPSCHPVRPVPVVAFHGTADPLLPFRGGVGRAASSFLTPAVAQAMGPFLPRSPARGGRSVQGTAAAWAHRNGCSLHPVTSRVTGDVNLIRYPCRQDATVELYVVRGGGHTWPGSRFSQKLAGDLGRTTLSISADQIMWQFFRAHPLTPRD